MLALTFQGQRTIKLDTVPLPQLQHDTDVIVKVTLCSICGRCAPLPGARPSTAYMRLVPRAGPAACCMHRH
jgi:hypothetical protein